MEKCMLRFANLAVILVTLVIGSNSALSQTLEEKFASQGHPAVPIKELLNFDNSSSLKFNFEQIRTAGNMTYFSDNTMELIIEEPRHREINGVWRIEDEYTICREYGNTGREFCARYYKSGDSTYREFRPDGSFVGDHERVD